MENTNEKQELEFSLLSFLKIFKGKLKMLVAIALIAAMLGGTIGALSSVLGDKEYGNLLAFQFPTQEQSGYSTVIPLLESDLFAEKILIGTKTVDYTDADGKTTSLTIPDLAYTAEQEAQVAEAEYTKLVAADKIKTIKDDLKQIPFELNLLKSELDNATNKFAPIEKEYETIWKMYSDTLYEDAKKKLETIQGPYDEAKAAFEAAQKAYSDCDRKQKSMENELYKAQNELNNATDSSDAIINALRAEWRKDKSNKQLVEMFHQSVTFSFTKDGSPLPTTGTTKEDTTGKFLYVDVRIANDEALANKIIDNVINEMAPFVISNTTPVEKNDAIKCVVLSTGDAKDLNEDSLLKNIILFAIIFFAIFELLACACIVLAHVKKTVFTDEGEAVAEADAKGSDEKDN